MPGSRCFSWYATHRPCRQMSHLINELIMGLGLMRASWYVCMHQLGCMCAIAKLSLRQRINLMGRGESAFVDRVAGDPVT
jgi:hypothetical protein